VIEFAQPLNSDIATTSLPTVYPPSYATATTSQNQNGAHVDTVGVMPEAAMSTAQIGYTGWAMAVLAGAKMAYDYYNAAGVKKERKT
jgi:hypothetical protein